MKIRSITNVEVASICDNACEYCPAPQVKDHRYSGLMEGDTFMQAMKWVKHFTEQGTQGQLNLFGVGEPTLNHNLPEMVEIARESVPIFGHVRVNTNGNNMTAELASKLKLAGITDIHVTDHNAEVTLNAILILREAGVDYETNRDFVTGANNWAGQIEWTDRIDYELPCPWLGRGDAMVLADGSVTRCCLDAFGEGVLCNVWDDLTKVDMTPFALCESCHHTH